MKTTVELPDSLFREIKLKAVLEGRKLKDTMTDLLRAGLSATSSIPSTSSPKRAGLPIVKCRHAATPARELTPDRVAEILQDQDVHWHAKTGR